ncbi:MAG: hypothetical protein GF355_08375 [Candidatus Eisenbacteria bacterium]|nr:hypothetical protein [Candidatus Eisenbacteria bacterium]
MKLTRCLQSPAIVLLILPVLVFLGCEGDEGPAGPPGPQGPPGDTFEFSYIGGRGEECIHCHSGNVANVLLTGHNEAYDGLDEEDKDDPYCLQCHTTGWDSEVEFGDTEIDEYGPNPDGYDDYFGVDSEEADERREALEGVQCEACHGPAGPDFNIHEPAVSFATRFENGESLSLCDPCHETQLEEWVESGHGHGEEGQLDIMEFQTEHFIDNEHCARCHYSEGFIFANDPAFADYELPADHLYSFIGCVTCHDPHEGETGQGNIYQLRTVGDVEVVYHPGLEPGDPGVPVYTDYGTSQICASCHHGRRDADHVAGQIESGYAHFGPHSSPQMDMFIGAGCYEIDGYEYDGDGVHESLLEGRDGCVECHMVRETFLHGETVMHSFHTFSPTPENCTDTGCHGDLPDFDYNDVQTDIGGLLDDIAELFGYTDAADFYENWDSEADGVEPWEREVAYAFFFVYNDGSMGVHNPEYAFSLLENAIDYYNSQP